MSPHCDNCDSHVSHSWERVFGIGDENEIRVCPGCAVKNIPDATAYGGGEHRVSETTASGGQGRGFDG